jgi:hypothetical protein
MGKAGGDTRRSRRRRSANWTRAEAQRVLDAWLASGLSPRAFATREGIGPSRLYWWAKQLRTTVVRENRAPRAPKLVPAIVKMAPMISLERVRGPVVVHSPAGMAIEITKPTEVTPAWLAEVVRELERRT